MQPKRRPEDQQREVTPKTWYPLRKHAYGRVLDTDIAVMSNLRSQCWKTLCCFEIPQNSPTMSQEVSPSLPLKQRHCWSDGADCSQPLRTEHCPVAFSTPLSFMWSALSWSTLSLLWEFFNSKQLCCDSSCPIVISALLASPSAGSLLLTHSACQSICLFTASDASIVKH